MSDPSGAREARELRAAIETLGRVLAREIAGALLLELRPIFGAAAVSQAPLSPKTERLLTAREAMARLSVSRSTLQNLQARGELEPIHVGRSLRYREADVSAFVRRLSGIAEPAGALARPTPPKRRRRTSRRVIDT